MNATTLLTNAVTSPEMIELYIVSGGLVVTSCVSKYKQLSDPVKLAITTVVYSTSSVYILVKFISVLNLILCSFQII